MASDWTITIPIGLSLHALLVRKQLMVSDSMAVFDRLFGQPINLVDKDEPLVGFLIWLLSL